MKTSEHADVQIALNDLYGHNRALEKYREEKIRSLTSRKNVRSTIAPAHDLILTHASSSCQHTRSLLRFVAEIQRQRGVVLYNVRDKKIDESVV